MKFWKRAGLGAAAIALCCVILLAAGWLPWAGRGQAVYVGGKQALFFPGDAPTAVLIAGSEEGTAYRPLVRALQKSGVPVLVTFHHAAENGEQGLGILSQEIDWLKEKTGLEEKELFLAGTHYGASSLLNLLVNQGGPYKGMAIAAPVLPASLKEETLVVDGNYRTQDEWLAGLSPQLIAQPTLLVSSAGDEVCDAYTMTLLYHYLSGDEIIHMGGIYQAQTGSLTLDIVDGGSHLMAASHPAMVKRILEFFTQCSGVSCAPYGMEPFAGIARFLLLAAVGVMGVCIARVAGERPCTVSYTVSAREAAPTVQKRMIKKGALSIGAAVVGIVLFYPSVVLFPNASPALLLFNGAAWGYGLLSFWGRAPCASVVKRGRGRVFWGAAAFLPALALLAIPFYGCPYHFPKGRHILGVLWGGAGLFLWMRFLLREEDGLREQTGSLPMQLGLWAFHLLPMAVLAAVFGLFSGGIAAFAQPLSILGVLAAFYGLALGAFAIWGSASWAALAAAFMAQAAAAVFF